MYLIRFLPNFAVFCVFLWISQLCNHAKYQEPWLGPASFTFYKLATKNLHLATIVLQLVAERRPDDFFNFEPCKRLFNLPVQAFPWCSDGCPVRVVEYKWAWKHRDLHPKQAFLTPEIGGIQNGNKFAFKCSLNYYFQVKLQMFVSSLTWCIFVVWTNKGIFTVEVQMYPVTQPSWCPLSVQSWRSSGQVRFFLS